MRRTRSGLWVPQSGIFLPAVGPFASLTAPNVNTLPNHTVLNSTTETVGANFKSAPLKYNTLTLEAFSTLEVDLSTSNTCTMLLWVNNLVMQNFSILNANGGPGQDGQDLCCTTAQGGSGGVGGSGGGGGGAQSVGACPTLGGNGGTGTNGQDGQSFECGFTAGSGGIGYGTGYNAGFAWPNGSDGASGLSCESPGLGGPGFGGGGEGGGGAGGCGGPVSAGGGGGGGGSLIGVVCNSFDPNFADGVFLWSFGGAGGGGLNNAANGTNGGDGVIYIATKALLQSAANIGVSANIVVYEITHANALVLRADWNTGVTWDNR